MALTCECGNKPTYTTMLIVGTGDSKFGTETDYNNYLFCDDCVVFDEVGVYSAQNDGHSLTWRRIERYFVDYIPEGWELLEIDVKEIKREF